MKQRILFKVVFLFCSISFFAQDYHFSQFNAIPFWLNPANIGQTADMDIGLIYRTQYTGINNPYNTYGAFASASLLKRRDRNSYLGLGIGFIQDDNKNVQYKSSLAALSFSYHLRISKTNLISVGLQPFFFQNSVNYNSLKWGNQYDGTNYNSLMATGEPGSNFSKLSKIDGSFGLNYQYSKGAHNSIVESENKFQAGLSMYHLPGVKYSLYDSQEKIYSRFCLNLSYTYKGENSRIGFNPLLYYQKQGPASEIVFGCNVFYIVKESSTVTGYVKGASFNAGLLYRVNDAIIATALINYDYYSFGLAYDINTSSLTTSTKTFGAFELSVRYKMNKGHGR